MALSQAAEFCIPLQENAKKLERMSKERSKAEHRKEARDALERLQAENPICFGGEIPMPPPAETPVAGIPLTGSDYLTLLWGVGGVAVVGTVLYFILRRR